VDIFSDRRSIGKRTIKGDKSFETRDEALEHSRILLLQIDPKAAGGKKE
jgi:hypothetical protein